ncbi:MAG: hypothetical protein FJ387_10070 [Verrucomicrobia bacterium]|nr:hypothetical protein [Verrucomicrobiota bacterium]
MKTARPTWLRTWAHLALALGLLLALPTWGAGTETNRAKLHFSGFGWLGNLELKKQVRLMQPDKKLPPQFSANQIEDIVLILLSKLKGDGYLEPEIRAELTRVDGGSESYLWSPGVEPLLPSELAIRQVQLRARRGVRAYYERLEIRGLTALPLAEVRPYFVSTDALLRLKSMRVFTPDRLQGALARLEGALARRGYEQAQVVASMVQRDPATGATQVEVTVQEGLPAYVRSVDVEICRPTETAPERLPRLEPGVPFSRLWEQDFLLSLRTNQYARGFPDATAEMAVLRRETNAVDIQVDLRAVVTTGTNIAVRRVQFDGRERTRESMLRRFARATPGAPLNRLQAERGRERLARLGLFETVGLRYDSVDPYQRDIVYELQEGKSFTINLVSGYGSYDQLGGGVELLHRNMFGRAHQAKLTAAQTFKSTLGDFRYTLPEVMRQSVDVFFTGSLLRREEISFTREEYGGGVGVHRFFETFKTDATLRYDHQFLNAQAAGFVVDPNVALEEARAAALVLELKHDRRDNPLHPRSGYKLFGSVEFASEWLGGEVNYQRVLLGGSAHWDLGGGRVFHLGATHGLSFTLGGEPRELPFNKRFFPGGDNSVRGYQLGEAAPRNASGQIVGAETYLQGNVEFEQYLTPTLSLVAFTDAVGFAEQRRAYPFDETLISVGAGLRWRTVIGPVRLEYGYNLNPRPRDPTGTIHLSFGFPF